MVEELIVIVKPHFGNPYKAKVARITAKWIVVICNELATMKFDREMGYTAGAFKDRQSLTPSQIVNLVELNSFANSRGGTWDSGWKPKKRVEK